MSKSEATPAIMPGTSKTEPTQQTLVEKTPLGLTAEQMRKSNADAVASLEQHAATAAVAADRTRLSDLKAAFADDPAYAMTAYEAGQSVEQAKAARHDVLAKEFVALREENKTLKAKAEEGVVGFAASDKSRAAATAVSDDQIEAHATALWNKHESLREEFRGQKQDFLALYKQDPQEFASLK